MTGHLVILEATTTGAGLLVLQTARRLGLEVTFLTRDPERYRRHQLSGSLDDAHRVVIVETTSLPHVLGCMETLPPADGLICLTDGPIEIAARVAERYGLPFMAPNAVALARNKDRTRALCAELGLPGPQFALVRNPAEAQRLAGEWGFPVILKPARGTGSIKVFLCRTSKELSDAFAAFTADAGGVLMEEFLRGPLYSLEALTFAGETTFLGLTDRVLGEPPAFVELSDAFPARLDPASYHAACDMVTRLLQGAGITFGATHTEFILTRRGPVLVELNPRLAGGLIGPMISASYGIDIYAQIIRMALGLRPRVPAAPVQGAAEICLYASRAGRIRRIHGIETARSFPGVQQIVVRAAAGDTVAPPVDFRGDYAYLWATGPNAEMAAANCRAAAGAIWLEFES